MTDFFTFTGTPPIDCYPPAPLKPEQVLEIMAQQLKVLANMTARAMLIPAGTKITPVDLKGAGASEPGVLTQVFDGAVAAGKLQRILGIAREAREGESTDWFDALRDICAVIAGVP